VSELRIHYGPGYRVYFVQRGRALVILLCGGDKSSQAGDIKTAKRLASELEDWAMVKTRPYDSAEHLDSPEAIAAYLSEALETGDRHSRCHRNFQSDFQTAPPMLTEAGYAFQIARDERQRLDRYQW
jgi:hypothetical protein